MNPRHRRLLIPGLLVALVVVVVVASLVDRADAADRVTPPAEVVSIIDDARITEASGLAVSVRHDDLVYVVNDSGNAQVIYAVERSTGRVVGTTTVTGGTWRDTEALAISPDGTLWVADTGDNLVRRTDTALYALPEPGRGDHRVAATRYPVACEGGPEDVEALLIDPRDGAKYLVSKGLLAGELYRLPDELRTSTTNRAVRAEGRAPGVVTDGAFTPDGAHVLLRTYAAVHEYATSDWEEERVLSVPVQEQGESLAVEPDGRSFLLGTEGRPSPLLRVDLPAASSVTPPAASASASPSPVMEDATDPAEHGWTDWAWIVAGGAGVVVAAVLTTRRVLRRR